MMISLMINSACREGNSSILLRKKRYEPLFLLRLFSALFLFGDVLYNKRNIFYGVAVTKISRQIFVFPEK